MCEKVGNGSTLSFPILSVDHAADIQGMREKRGITIGSGAVIGYRAHLAPGSVVGDYSMVRFVERLTDECLGFRFSLEHAERCTTTEATVQRSRTTRRSENFFLWQKSLVSFEVKRKVWAFNSISN